MTDFEPEVAAAFERLDGVNPPDWSSISDHASRSSGDIPTPPTDVNDRPALDLGSIRPEEPKDSGKWRPLATAAACIAIVVGAVAIAASLLSTSSIVASQPEDAPSPAENPSDANDELARLGLVRAPDQPLVVIGTSESAQDEASLVELCAAEDFGEAPFVEASAFLIEGFTFALGRSGVFGAEHCFETAQFSIRPGPGGQGPQTNTIVGDPLEVLSVNTVSQGETVSEVLLVGRIDDGPIPVENIVVADPEVDLLGFERSGDWFVMWWQESTSSHVFNREQGYRLMLDTTFEDGSTEQIEWTGNTRDDDCFELDCIEQQMTTAMMAASLELGNDLQGESLADGVLTQEEYDLSVAAFAKCLSVNGIREIDSGTVALQAGSDEAEVASTCWQVHAQHVEEFRTWQWWRAFIVSTTEDIDESAGEPEERMATVSPIPTRLDGALRIAEVELPDGSRVRLQLPTTVGEQILVADDPTDSSRATITAGNITVEISVGAFCRRDASTRNVRGLDIIADSVGTSPEGRSLVELCRPDEFVSLTISSQQSIDPDDYDLIPIATGNRWIEFIGDEGIIPGQCCFEDRLAATNSQVIWANGTAGSLLRAFDPETLLTLWEVDLASLLADQLTGTADDAFVGEASFVHLLGDDVVVVSTGFGYLMALDAQTGQPVWTLDLDGRSPAQLRTFDGPDDFILTSSVQTTGDPSAPVTQRIDRLTGNVRWESQGTPNTQLQWHGLEVVGDVVVVVDVAEFVEDPADQQISGVSAFGLDLGDLIWRASLDSTVEGFLSVASIASDSSREPPLLLVQNVENTLFRFDASNGSELWRSNVGVREVIGLSPDTVSATTVDNTDVELSLADGSLTDALPAFGGESSSYLGLSIDDAAALATRNRREWRIVEVDGFAETVRLNFLANRLNFTVVNGFVIGAATDQELRDDQSQAGAQ